MSVCILALVIRHANHIISAPYYIVIFGLSGCTVFFSLYVINVNIFGKELLNINYVFWVSLQLLSETFLVLRRIQRGVINLLHRSSCKVPVVIVRFKLNLNFLERFSENPHISNFMKIGPVGAELFRADRRTDARTDRHDEANSRFSQFCERI